jgi:hypothetical protein
LLGPAAWESEKAKPVNRGGIKMCGRRGWWVLGCMLIGLMLANASVVSGEIPKRINYQGRLVDSVTGEPLAGSHSMEFRIYDAAIGGSLLWSEDQPVSADSAGVVSVIVGMSSPIDISFDGSCWLEVVVDDEALSPRRELVSVPYAFRALNCDHAASSDSLGGYQSDSYSLDGHIHDDQYFTESELNDAGTLNDPSNPVDWSKLKNVPADFADGIDNVGGNGGEGDVTDVFGGEGLTADSPEGPQVTLHVGAGEGIDVSTDAISVKASSITSGMIKDGEIVDGDIFGGAEIDPAKIAGTAWTSNNDGAGSGLDADILDGYHADAFSPTGHFHDDRYHRKEELGTPGTLNEVGNPMDWTKLKGVPAGFADGIDDGGGWVDDGAVVRLESETDLVGIGTVSPVAKLDVDGDINAQSCYRIEGTKVFSTPLGENVFVGDNAGISHDTGSHNTFVGHVAGYANQTGNNNTFLGHTAGRANQTGHDNTFLGHAAGYASEGNSNTFVGALAGSGNDIGHDNTFIGSWAGELNETGSHNTFIGNTAGSSNQTGSGNTLIGDNAGEHNMEGNGNVFIGCDAGANETGSNKLYIANGPADGDVLIHGDFGSGFLGLGTLDPSQRLHIKGVNPRILIEASSSSPEINFESTGDGSSERWSIYKFWQTDDLHFYQGSNKVTIQSGTGNVGIGTDIPAEELHVVGDIYCTGKLTSDGGNDPPYVLYDRESRQAVMERVAEEVPEDKLDGAVLFWNGDEERFEVYLAAIGEFRDLGGNVLARASELEAARQVIESD